MPRNPGTGVYAQPSPDVITATTIESTVYNGFVNDVETDLNLPRPIVAGGTGASSAAAARDNLDAEVSMQAVTNYNTQVFESGSFYSTAGATAAPNGSDIFFGVAYIDVTNGFIEARSLTTGKLYVRKKNPSWNAWVEQGGSVTELDARYEPLDSAYTKAESDAAYVNITGDTMTGRLNANAGISMGSATAASTTDLSKHINLYANDQYGFCVTGGTLNLVAGGVAAVQVKPTGEVVTGRLDVSQGVYSAGLTSSVVYGGCSLILRDATSTWSKGFRVNSSGALEIVNHANTGIILTLTDAGTLGVSGNITASNVTVSSNVGGNVFVASTNGAYTLTSNRGLYDDGSGSSMLLRANITHVQTSGGALALGYWATAGLTVSTGSAFKPGGGAWGDSSDARIKNIVGEYKNGLESIKTLHPVVYTFKGNEVIAETQGLMKEDTVVPYKNSPHYNAAVENTKFIGLIAQECEKEFPEMISLRAGIIDSKPVNDIRGLDSTPLIFALVNAVKELSARLETLEAAQTTP